MEDIHILDRVRAYVKLTMAYNDHSHDFAHVERVMDYTAHIAKGEGFAGDEILLWLAALMHDVKDHKYLKEGEDEHTASNTIITVLTKHGYPMEKAERVAKIVSQISYTHEVSSGQSPDDMLEESKIIQDADRMDAMGAVGIARAFTYGATKNQSLRETIRHFEDKLLKLHGMMKTATGSKISESRHRTLVKFYHTFEGERFTSSFFCPHQEEVVMYGQKRMGVTYATQELIKLNINK